MHKSQPGSGSHLQNYKLEDSDEEYEYVEEEYFEEERIPISKG